MNYSSLTPNQREQVAYLFADEFFGTDAGAYLYEVKDGVVTGRTRTGTPAHRAKQSAPVMVKMIEEVHVTNEMLMSAHMAMDALAASAAGRMFNLLNQTRKLEEVKS